MNGLVFASYYVQEYRVRLFIFELHCGEVAPNFCDFLLQLLVEGLDEVDVAKRIGDSAGVF